MFSPTLSLIYIFFYYYYLPPKKNNKVLPRFKYFNSRSPLPFLIVLSPITHVKALPD
ncbi:hypothetical protein HanLR1_Chr07g0252941 [Helianthus annuus]|nr:hypothetical protein HanHA89_Chr07g0270621 [Helianthus annuus]KAJ0729439.1 hypothetical protein HanLR1_Chr07g0252941 [Helianthus annuus]